MSQSLYIFVTSERPDPYLNPIIHCLLQKNIRKVVFLHIKNLGDEATNVNDSDKGISLIVFINVRSLLVDLSKGFYGYYVDEKKGEKVNLLNLYLFSWDEIPGNGSVRLINFLKQKFSIDWVKTAIIEKIDNGKTIRVSTEKNYILLKLNNEKTKLNIEIDDGRTDEFSAKTENDRIEIYLNLYPKEKLSLISALYRQCLDMEVRWDYKDINYLNIKKELADIHRKEPDSIFDVTALSKSYIGDIVSCFIIEGIHNLYTFDLKNKPNFDQPWTMLFHELWSNKDDYQYRYTNIVDTPIFRDCSNSILIRALPIKISISIATILLLVLIVTYYYFGEVNWLVQTAFIVSAVSSMFSLYLTLFPQKK